MMGRDSLFDDWEPLNAEAGGLFAETRRSLLDGLEGTAEQRAASLETLCRTYRHPLVCFARARGLREFDAEDAVQGFFLKFLSRDGFGKARRREGKLRSFLMAAFENYRTDEWRRTQAKKRGGGEEPLPLTEANEPADGETPERIYDREWGRALQAAALEEVRREVLAKPNGALVWRVLSPLVTEPAAGKGECKAAAREMGIGQSAARSRLERLRKRYEQALFVEAAATLRRFTYETVMEELRALKLVA